MCSLYSLCLIPQLDKLFEMHMADAAITNDDRKLLSSALTFSEKVTNSRTN